MPCLVLLPDLTHLASWTSITLPISYLTEHLAGEAAIVRPPEASLPSDGRHFTYLTMITPVRPRAFLPSPDPLRLATVLTSSSGPRLQWLKQTFVPRSAKAWKDTEIIGNRAAQQCNGS